LQVIDAGKNIRRVCEPDAVAPQEFSMEYRPSGAISVINFRLADPGMIGVEVHNRRMHGVYEAVDLFPERRTSDHSQSSPIIAAQEWLMGGRPGSSAVSNRPKPIQQGQSEVDG
jgi:hypothetical protein